MFAPDSLEEGEAALAQPRFFGPRDCRLFGWYHAPPDGTRDCAVVLCNPWGYEALCTHRSYVHFAQRLAAAGFPTLRFDYLGTGDSSGEDDLAADQLQSWIRSIRCARREAESVSGVSSVAIFGLRLGATLAAAAAAEERVESLILWAPLLRGRAYARELRAFGLIRQPGRPQVESDDGGLLEASGFFFTPQVVDELAAVDLLKTAAKPCEAALLLARDDQQLEKPLANSLAKLGVDAAFRYVPGYAEMMREPHQSILPAAVFDEAIGWLSKRHGWRTSPAARATPSLSAPSGFADLELAGCRERAIVFGSKGVLTGILTEPLNLQRASSSAVLLLNVGSNHHIGPSRIWVSLARGWARKGFRVLRFDVTGLGDSFAPDEPASQRLYAKASIPDLKEALDLLQAEAGVQEALVVGLCSGAYLAFYAALADPRIRALALMNLQTFHWKAGDSLEIALRGSYKSTQFYLGAALRQRIWIRLFRGEVNLFGILGALTSRLGRKLKFLFRPTQRDPDSIDVAQAFRSLTDRGTRVLLVYSGEDGGRDEIDLQLGRNARKMRGRSGFRMEIVEGADHIFTSRSTRERLTSLLGRQLEWLVPGTPATPDRKTSRAD
jgi:pimeloyl-ACP methyl ester carboxylesterase